MDKIKLILVVIKTVLPIIEKLIGLVEDSPEGRRKSSTIVLVIALVVSVVLAFIGTPPINLLHIKV